MRISDVVVSLPARGPMPTAISGSVVPSRSATAISYEVEVAALVTCVHSGKPLVSAIALFA